jgi:hypothetical protein
VGCWAMPLRSAGIGGTAAVGSGTAAASTCHDAYPAEVVVRPVACTRRVVGNSQYQQHGGYSVEPGWAISWRRACVRRSSTDKCPFVVSRCTYDSPVLPRERAVVRGPCNLLPEPDVRCARNDRTACLASRCAASIPHLGDIAVSLEIGENLSGPGGMLSVGAGKDVCP